MSQGERTTVPNVGSVAYTLTGVSSRARIYRAELILNPPMTKEEELALRHPAGEPADKVRYVSSFCAEGQCRNCVGCYHKCSHGNRRAS